MASLAHVNQYFRLQLFSNFVNKISTMTHLFELTKKKKKLRLILLANADMFIWGNHERHQLDMMWQKQRLRSMKDTQIIVLISKLLRINHAAFHLKYTKTVKIITLAAIIHEHSHYEGAASFACSLIFKDLLILFCFSSKGISCSITQQEEFYKFLSSFHRNALIRA